MAGVPPRYGQSCPVAKSLEVVGDRWTLLIVRDLLRGARRFQDLQSSLAGIAPNILSDRLKLMERHGLVARSLYSRRPRRAQYALTEKGRGLGLVVGALASWGSRHVWRRARLVHADCGHEVGVAYHCTECGGRVPGAAVEMRRLGRPGAAVPPGLPATPGAARVRRAPRVARSPRPAPA
jgi:DNA-binding HxlR family transcriptional regulator